MIWVSAIFIFYVQISIISEKLPFGSVLKHMRASGTVFSGSSPTSPCLRITFCDDSVRFSGPFSGLIIDIWIFRSPSVCVDFLTYFVAFFFCSVLSSVLWLSVSLLVAVQISLSIFVVHLIFLLLMFFFKSTAFTVFSRL